MNTTSNLLDSSWFRIFEKANCQTFSYVLKLYLFQSMHSLLFDFCIFLRKDQFLSKMRLFFLSSFWYILNIWFVFFQLIDFIVTKHCVTESRQTSFDFRRKSNCEEKEIAFREKISSFFLLSFAFLSLYERVSIILRTTSFWSLSFSFRIWEC